MLGTFRKTPGQLAASAQVRAWTKARFGLGQTDAVIVTQLACRLPGCPPFETIVAFWDDIDPLTRYHYKVFKPVEQIVEADLPPAWLKPGLIYDQVAGCACC